MTQAQARIRIVIASIAVLGLLLPGCSIHLFGLHGNIDDGAYRSPSGSYSCRLPGPRGELEIDDAIEESGEWVSFDQDDGWSYRMDYYRLGVSPIASPPPGLTDSERLEMIARRFIEFTLELDHPRVTVLHSDDRRVNDRQVRIDVVRLGAAEPWEHLGLLTLVHRPNAAVIQAHRAGVSDVDAIIGQLLSFAEGCVSGRQPPPRWLQ